MHNINPGLPKSDSNPQKSIFSYIHRTNNQQKPHQRTSFKPNTTCKDPEVLFLNEKIFKVKPKPRNEFKECSTQTSKTILELAQTDAQKTISAEQPKEIQVNAEPNIKIQITAGEQNTTRTYNFSSAPKGAGVSKIAGIFMPTGNQNARRCRNTLPNCSPPFGTNKPENNDASRIQKESQASVLEASKNPNVQIPTLALTQNVPPSKNLNRNRSGSPVRIGVQIEILGEEQHEETQKEVADQPGNMSPDSLAVTPRECTNNYSLENCPYSVVSKLSQFTLDGSCHEQDCIFNENTTKYLEKPLTQTFLEKNRSRIPNRTGFKSKSFIDTYQHPNYIQDNTETKSVKKPRVNRRSSRSLNLPDNSFERIKPPICNQNHTSFMHPTTASRIKSQMEEIRSTICLIAPMRRGKSTSPKPSADRRRFESSKKVPYIDQSKSDVSSSTTLINATRHPERVRLQNIEGSKSDCSIKFSDDVLSLITTMEASNSTFNDTSIMMALNKLQEQDWRVALRGLADVVEICRTIDEDAIYEYMSTINQRLLELLKSPRSHVCRIACQAAGHLFEYIKDTRRPVFDEIVDTLLHKTADANKFIRHDANMALDSMVTHISIFNSVRALCCKGPFHKNSLVRCATARLLVCAIVLAGTDFLLNPNSNEFTRKRIIVTMARFLEDRSLETRKLAERLYKVLSKDLRFDVYLKKYLETEQINKIKKTLRLIRKK